MLRVDFLCCSEEKQAPQAALFNPLGHTICTVKTVLSEPLDGAVKSNFCLSQSMEIISLLLAKGKPPVIREDKCCSEAAGCTFGLPQLAPTSQVGIAQPGRGLPRVLVRGDGTVFLELTCFNLSSVCSYDPCPNCQMSKSLDSGSEYRAVHE